MEIKPVKKSEISACAMMAIKEWAKKPFFEKWTKKSYYFRLKEIFDASPRSCLCVKEADKIAGFVFCRTVTWFDGKHANIEEMVVDSGFQGRGLGQKLLSALEKKLHRSGVSQIDGISNKRSTAFIFFKKAGFKASDWIYLSKKNK